jgi:hypothetical protein
MSSSSVKNILNAASQFLHGGGEQVVITTLRGLSNAMTHQGGFRIGTKTPSVELFQIHVQAIP